MEAGVLGRIFEDLEFLKREIIEIREHMIDRDAILTEDERVLLEKAREEHKKGETISLEELESEFDG